MKLTRNEFGIFLATCLVATVSRYHDRTIEDILSACIIAATAFTLGVLAVERITE